MLIVMLIIMEQNSCKKELDLVMESYLVIFNLLIKINSNSAYLEYKLKMVLMAFFIININNSILVIKEY